MEKFQLRKKKKKKNGSKPFWRVVGKHNATSSTCARVINRAGKSICQRWRAPFTPRMNGYKEEERQTVVVAVVIIITVITIKRKTTSGWAQFRILGSVTRPQMCISSGDF